MKHYLASFLRLSLLFVLLAALTLQSQFLAYAAANLTVTPITWNVIGLDSNNVSVGPNHFPIGARVCNTGDAPATNVTANFVWDSGNGFINIRPGTLSTLSVASLSNVSPNNCADFYFEVEVTRNSSAYDTTRNYHIAVTADGGLSASTPAPRTLYVEHLVSQSRNAVTDVRYGTTLADLALPASSVAPGGTMTLMVGNTYYIRLIGYTATQGYEQLESFINIPNIIFQTLSVTTTYTANTSGTVSSTNDKAYGDACIWENDPNSPNYRSCLSTGKVGGDITVTYQVKILQIPGAPLVNPAPLSTLIYDFSGSSFHYNADYDVSTRFANIVNASITKAFSPKTINPGQTSTLTFTVNNPGPAPLIGVNFTDTLPAGMTLANTTVTYNGCGASPSPATLTVNGPPQSLSFSSITVAGLGTCTIAVSVTASTDATYANTSNHLFINTSTDTGSFATDSLVVSSKPAPPPTCTTRTALATWSLENYTAGTATQSGPFAYSAKQTDVATATATYGAVTGSSSGIANTTTFPTGWPAPSATGNSGNSWGIRGGWLDANPANPVTATTPYFQFAVDASNYGGIGITTSYNLQGNWSNAGNWYVLFSTDGTNWSSPTGGVGAWDKANAWQTGAAGITTTTTNTAPTVYFRVFAAGAQYGGNPRVTTGTMYLDNIQVTGCPRPVVPTLSKNFSPAAVPQGSNSTLTFTLVNPNATALTGVGFSDTLSTGLLIASPSGLTTTCTTGTLTGTPAATSGSTLISLSGATLSANANCTISVSVRGNVPGQYTNISSSITSTETGPNTTSTGYGTSSLTVVAPPVIAKSFAANPIFTGNTTTLTFSINNPNMSATLTGINFTDTLPAGLDVLNSTTAQCGGTLTVTDNAPAQDTISLNGASLNAGGSCSVTATVTGNTVGLKTNSVTVSSTNGGTGNTDTATVLVKDRTPAINLLKQVGPTATGPWSNFLAINPGVPATYPQTVYFRFTVENTGDLALANVSITDVTIPGLDLTNCAAVLTGGLALYETKTCVSGVVNVNADGAYLNTAYATGDTATSPNSSARYATTGLTLDKTATQTSFTVAGDTLNYNYLVTNSGFASLLGPVTVTDDKTTVTCPAVNTVGDNDTWLDVGEQITCTATYTVQPSDAAAGFVTNTASATVSGVTSNTDSLMVNQIRPDLTVTKTNNVSGTVAQNGTFTWTLTVANGGTATASFADTQTILSDALPGAAVYSPQGALTVAVGGIPPTGTIGCSIAGSALSCVANGPVTLPVAASFSVTFSVNPTAAGSLSNTAIVDLNGNVAESNETNNSSIDIVAVIAPPSITKSFALNPIVVGGTSTLTFTLTNPNGAVALTGVGFTDTLPAGLQVAATPNDTTSAGCGTPGFTPATGNPTLTFTGGTIPAGGTCTVTVDVTATTGGTKDNTTSNVTSANGGTGNTASASLNVFEASPSKSIVATSEPSTGLVAGTERVVIGEMVRYRLATLIPQGSFTNVQLLDGLPTGLQFLDDGTATVAFVCSGGAGCMTSSTLSGAGLVVNGSTSAVSPTFVILASAIGTGPFGSGTDVTFSLGNITNSDADADSEYVVVEFNALVLNVNSAVTINQGTNNQTGANINNNRQNDLNLLVNGSVIGSVSPNVTVAIAEPAITSFTKSVAPAAGPYLPGDALTYTLSFSNTTLGNTNAATAFDIVLTDTFDANLALGSVNVASTQGATCAGGTAFSFSNPPPVGQVVTVNVSCLDPGNTVTVTVNATIGAGVTSGTTISNSSGLTYTSLPGAQGTCAAAPFSCSGIGASGSGTGERNGSGGPGADGTVLNNYATVSNTVNTTVAFGSITIVLDTVPDNAQDFAFTGTGPNGYNFGGGFNLDDDADGTLSNTRIFVNLVPGSYSTTEGTVAGWNLTGLTCTDPDSGSTTDLGTATATIDLDAGESIVCTFTNAPSAAPSLQVVKSSTTASITAAGQSVPYTFTVTNTGNVALTGVTVTDAMCSAAPTLQSGDTDNDTQLDLTETWIYACTHTVTQAEVNAGGNLTNTVTADSTESGLDTDTLNIPVTQTPGLTLTKTAAPASVTAAGDVVTYTFSVQNTGNVTLTNVTVTDPLLSGLNCTAIASLAPNATQAFTCTGNAYTVTQTDLDTNGGGDGDIDNTATTTGTTPDGGTTSDTDSQAVTLPAQNPAINIVKSPATQTVLSGGTANFTLTVTNTGNVTLTGVTVTDALCTTGPIRTGGDTNNDDQLQLAETWTYSCSVAGVTAGFTNTVDVTTNENATDSATANVTVALQQVDLELTKLVDNTSPLVATNITFTLTVTNVDAIDATNVIVRDVIPAGFSYLSNNSGGAYNTSTGLWTVGTVPANSSRSLAITVLVNVPGPYTNYAEVTAADQVDPDSTPNNNSTNEDDDDSVTVTPTQNNPNLGKSVSGSNQAFTTNPNVAIGEIVEYTVTVNIPPGIFTNARLVDFMERGLSFITCSSITPSNAALTTDVAGSFPGACSTPTVDDAGGGTTVDAGRRVTFNLGTLTNSSGANQTLTFTYTAVVLDSAGNISGVALDNSAVWASDSGTQPPSTTAVLVVEPDLSISKTANTSLVSVGSEITITLTIQHTATSETNAYDAMVTDVLPAQLELVLGTLECASGAQNANVCNYDAGTRAVSAAWNTFTRGGGIGRVTFRVRVVSLPSSGVSNTANVVWTSLPGNVSTPQNSNVFSTERDYDPASQIDVYGASDTLVVGVFSNVPATGFAPNVVTNLGNVQKETYTQTGGVTVEVPSLGINIPIVGVPLKNGEWNVSWLGDQAGWLEGSAFPSWSGNSVLTSHVYGSNGLPGPFVNLNKLKYGDKIIVHAYGRKYTYEVRANTVVEPNDASIFRHEEKAWLTLVTCKEYDEKTNTYKKRVVVRAVLVSVGRE